MAMKTTRVQVASDVFVTEMVDSLGLSYFNVEQQGTGNVYHWGPFGTIHYTREGDGVRRDVIGMIARRWVCEMIRAAFPPCLMEATESNTVSLEMMKRALG